MSIFDDVLKPAGVFRSPRQAAQGTPPVPGFEFDPALADLDSLRRGYQSNAQLGQDYAAQALARTAKDARRQADRLLKLKEQRGLSLDETNALEKLLGIAETGQEPPKPNLFFKMIDYVDRLGQVGRLALADVFLDRTSVGAGKGKGATAEIEGDDYWNAFMGRKQILEESLGTELLGEDLRLSGSQILKLAGREEGDGFIDKSVRFIETLGVEILTDPLSYVGAGGKGVSAVSRISMVGKGVDDAADLALAVARGLDSSGDDLVRIFADDIVERAPQIERTLIDDALKSVGEVDDPLGDMLGILKDTDEFRDQAMDLARNQVADEWFNRGAQAAAARDFGDPVLRQIADSSVAGNTFLKGGVQLMLPFGRKTAAKFGIQSAVIPGTRGLGRTITRGLFGASSQYPLSTGKGLLPARQALESGFLRGMYTRWDDVTSRWQDVAFIRGVARGKIDASIARTLQQEFIDLANTLGGGRALDELGSIGKDIINQSSKAGLDQQQIQDIVSTMGSMVEAGKLNSMDEVVSHIARRLDTSASTMPPDVIESVYRYGLRYKQAFDDVNAQAVKVGLWDRGFENYVPHILRSETRGWLDDFIRNEAIIQGDALGDQMLRQIVENHKLQRGVTQAGQEMVGETRFAQERLVGRTAVQGTGNEIIPQVIGDTALHNPKQFGPGSLTVEQLNDDLLGAMQRVSDDTPGLGMPALRSNRKATFTPYNTNPLETAQIYLRDLNAAVMERHMISRLEDVGLVSDGVKHLNQQRLAADLAANLGKYGKRAVLSAQARVGKLAAQNLEELGALRNVGVENVDMVRVSVGGAIDIDIPEATIEASAKLARQVRRFADDERTRDQVRRQAQQFFEDTKRGLLREGLPDEVADRVARQHSARELHEVIGETRKGLRQQALDELDIMRVDLATADRDAAVARTVLDDTKRYWQEQIENVSRQRVDINRQLDGMISEARPAPQPVTSSAAALNLSDQIRDRHIEVVADMNRFAEEIRASDPVFSDQVLGLAAQLDSGSITMSPASLDDLTGRLRAASSMNAQQREWMVSNLRPQIKQATEFRNFGFEDLSGGVAGPHSGTWRPSDIRYVYHGSANPWAKARTQVGSFYGGGITVNPHRAGNYANQLGGHVYVWDVNDFGPEAAALLRAGNDIEDAESLLALWRQGGGTGAYPKPRATYPQDVWLESGRVLAGPTPSDVVLAKQTAVRGWLTDVGPALGLDVNDENLEVAVGLFDDEILPRLAAGEPLDEVAVALAGDTDVPADQVLEAIHDLNARFTRTREALNQRYDFSDVGSTLPPQSEPRRQSALSAWRDRWQEQAQPPSGPVIQSGEPYQAEWTVLPSEGTRITPHERIPYTIQHPMTRTIQLPGEALDLWISPAMAQSKFRGALATDQYARFAEDWFQPLNLDRTYFNQAATDVAEGVDVSTRLGLDAQQVAEMKLRFENVEAGIQVMKQDVTEASRHSLIARGLPDEFPVWARRIDQTSGTSVVSLSPVEGAQPFYVNRADVLADLGIFEKAGREPSQFYDMLLLDANKLTRAADDITPSGGRALPSKLQLHQLRPDTISLEYMRQFFPDGDTSVRAYNDLMDRLAMLNKAEAHTAQGRFESWLETVGVAIDSTGWHQYGEALESMEVGREVSQDWLASSNVFFNPEMQARYADELNILGYDVQFQNVYFDPTSGRLVDKTMPGAQPFTVPVLVDDISTVPTTMTRVELEQAVDAAGVTIGTARAHLRWFDEFVDQAAATAADQGARYRDAARFVESADPRLIATVRGMRDEVAEQFDNYLADLSLTRAEKAAQITDKDRFLGLPGRARAKPGTEIAETIRESLEAAWTVNAETATVVNPRTGRVVPRGTVVSAWADESLRFPIPKGGLTPEVFARFADDVALWADDTADLARGRSTIVAYRQGDELVVEVASSPEARKHAEQIGLLTETTAAWDARSGQAVQIPKTRRAAQQVAGRTKAQQDAAAVVDRLYAQMRGNDAGAAWGLLQQPENIRLLKAQLSGVQYDRLYDLVRSEQLIKERIVPQVNALRSQRKFVQAMGDTARARETLDVMTQEAKASRAMAVTADTEALYDSQIRFNQILEEVFQVGIAEPGAPFTNPSLYPNISSVENLTPDEALLARVKEAKRIADDLGWGQQSSAIKKVLDDPPWEVLPPRGKPQHTTRLFGIGGRVTTYKTTDIWTAGMLERMIGQWQLLNTPQGMSMFGEQARWLARAWKGMATVARPNFHIRNMIGGMWNNQIIDVGVTDYAWVRNRMLRLRNAQRRGATFEQAIGAFKPRDQEILKAMHDHRVLDLGFGATEFERVTQPILDRSMAGRARRLVNIGDPNNPIIRAGGIAMTSVEDYLRASAFVRWYDELGGTGAASMVESVHFNYTNLTDFDIKLKRFIPFWVWSKNNIPLQVKAALERPDLIARYNALMHAVDDSFGSDKDDWPVSPFLGDLAADTGFVVNGNTPLWSRLVFDPDLPLRDLDVLGNPLSLDTWMNLGTNLVGPHVESPFKYTEQQEWGQTNAPVGLNEILTLLDKLPLYDAQISAQGDVQIGFGSKSLFETAFPILNEYSRLAGISNDPNQQLKLGIINEDGVSASEQARAALIQLARGAGFQPSTPNDARSAAFRASQEVESIVDELKLAGLLTPEDFGQGGGSVEQFLELGRSLGGGK